MVYVLFDWVGNETGDYPMWYGLLWFSGVSATPILGYGDTNYLHTGGGTGYLIRTQISDTSLIYYAPYNAYTQLNIAGGTYFYFALL